MNDINEMIKQAYAYGANVALQEAGYAPAQAQAAAARLTLEKTAEEGEEGMSPALMALLGGGAGAVLGAGGGALYGHLAKKNLVNQLYGAGASAQKGGAKGIDKLKSLLSRGEGAAAAAPGKAPTMAGGMAPGEMEAAIARGAKPRGVPFGGRGSQSGAMFAPEQAAGLEEAMLASQAGPGRLEQLRSWLSSLPTKAVMPGGIASPVGSPMLGSTAGGAGLGALLGSGAGGVYGSMD
jgi:hypothetical protein